MNDLAVRNAEAPVTIEEAKKQTDLIIARATHWASSLMSVVEKCGMSKGMNGKKYLEVEAWQMIGEFAHVTPLVEWVRPWHDADGTLLGYEARVKLINDAGQDVGAGESSCGLDAFPCRGKKGSEIDKAAKSAAQTWATSRALRNKFAYVAKLGGYEAVPYEEMADLERRVSSPAPTPTQAPKPRRSAKAALGEALRAHCGKDMARFSKILEELTNKTTITALSEAEADAAYKRFEMAYLNVGPDLADDIPESWTPEAEAKA